METEKVFFAAAVGLWVLVTGKPNQLVLCCALDFAGAKVVLQHAKDILRTCPSLEPLVDVQAHSLNMPSNGSSLQVVSREHTSSRGLHPVLIIYDELGWAKDAELFQALLAAQASVPDPFFLMVSTVGLRRSGPLWTIKTLAEAKDPAVFWFWTSENLSPKISQEFLDQRRRVMLPVAFAREHLNQWVDGADGFTSTAVVDQAMGHRYTQQERGTAGVCYVCFVDLGVLGDPSVIAIGHEEDGLVYLDRLDTFQPALDQPVQLSAVEMQLVKLFNLFDLSAIQVESWQGMASVQRLQQLGLPVELYSPSQKRNTEQWGLLHHRLETRTIILPAHFRLREELLNLVYEVTPNGVRVLDRGKVHQDHAVALRGVCGMLGGGLAVNWEIMEPTAAGHRESGHLRQGVAWENLPAPAGVADPGPSVRASGGGPGINWGNIKWEKS